MKNKPNQCSRLPAIFFGIFLGLVISLGVPLFTDADCRWSIPLIAILLPTVGYTFGRFPVLFSIVVWLWVFPFGLEDP